MVAVTEVNLILVKPPFVGHIVRYLTTPMMATYLQHIDLYNSSQDTDKSKFRVLIYH